MNKVDIVRRIASKTGITQKNAEVFLDSFIREITDSLANGEKVQIVGFGTFEARDRAPRMGRNPRTNTPVPIPAKRTPSFKPSTALKNAVN